MHTLNLLKSDQAFKQLRSIAFKRLNLARVVKLQYDHSWFSNYFFSQLSFECADKIVLLTPSAAQNVVTYHGIPKDKIEVISNGIPLEDFSLIAENRSFRLKPPYRSLTVGGNVRKGISVLIRAAQIVKLKLDVEFLVRGAINIPMVKEALKDGLIRDPGFVEDIRTL